MSRLIFGTAGIPLSTVSNKDLDSLTASGIKRIGELGLGTMELEFVNKIYLNQRTIPLVAAVQNEVGLPLSAHAPYFINLNAKEDSKLDLSRAYIFNSAKTLYACGGTDVVFHCGFYMGDDSQDAYKKIRDQIFLIEKKLVAEDVKIRLRPEVSGKKSVFGSVEEVINLSRDLETVWPCIDFSHAYAREGGNFNSYEDFCSIMLKMKEHLGEESVHNLLHAHVSGIICTDKGEKKHENFTTSKFNKEAFVKALKDMNAGGRVICESDNLENDALIIKRIYEGLN